METIDIARTLAECAERAEALESMEWCITSALETVDAGQETYVPALLLLSELMHEHTKTLESLTEKCYNKSREERRAGQARLVCAARK